MKILVVGDPHGKLPKKIPKNIDLILITGDLGKADLARKRFYENIKREKKGLPEIEETSEFAKRAHMEIYNSSIKPIKQLVKIAPVYTILGNVGMYDSEVKNESKKLGIKLPLMVKNLKRIKNFRLINNSIANFRGLRIGGLEYFLCNNWIKEFGVKDKKRIKKARRETAKAKKVLRWFGKKKVDVLLCHQPPYGILDKTKNNLAPKHWQGKHAGSKVILNFVKKQKPRFVFCGHIHEGRGKKKVGKTIVINAGEGDWSVVDIN